MSQIQKVFLGAVAIVATLGAVQVQLASGHGDARSERAIDVALAALDDGPLDPEEHGDVTIDDRALLIYTSGTTGLPKAASISHRRILNWGFWFAGLTGAGPQDRLYDCLPLFHSVGGIVAPCSMHRELLEPGRVRGDRGP